MALNDRTCDTCGVTLMESVEGLLACPRCASEVVSSDAISLSISGLSSDGPAALAQRILIPPEVLARYTLGRVLGRGGAGLVVAAAEKATGQSVAIKFLTRLDDEAALARFLLEGEILREIRHPNVLPVRELGAMGHSPWIVCELLTGGNLRQLLDREGRLAPKAAVNLATGVLQGLAALHERGVVHRDIKPQNILFDDARRPHVADLGLAKLGGPDQQQLTRTGALLGTPKYMSPEQANGEPASTPADIYATALVLYEMLAGRPPFDDPSIFVLLMDQIQSAPPPLKENAPDIPDALHDVVHRALAKSPRERPETATAFAQELKRAVEPRARRTALSRAPGKTSLQPVVSVAAPPSTRPLTYAVVATGLLLVGLSVALMAPRPPVPVEVTSLPTPGTAPPVPSPSRAPAPSGRPRAAPLVVRRPSLIVPTSTGPWLTTTATPRILWRLPADRGQHPAALGHLAVVDGQTISASPDGLICFWDPDGTRRRAFRLRGGVPLALALAAYRATAATAHDDGTVRVWDLSVDPPRPVLEQSGLHARALALSPTGNRLAVQRADGSVTLVEPGMAPRHLREAALRVAFTRSGDHLITRDHTAALKVWQVATGTMRRLISTEAEGDGPLFASEHHVLLLVNGAVHSWSLTTGERLHSGWSPGEATTTLGLSPDGAALYACTAEGVRRFELATGAPRDLVEGLARATALAVSEDGRLVATASVDGVVAPGGGRALPSPLGLRYRVALSPDGRTFALATSRTLATGDVASRTLTAASPIFETEAPTALALAGGFVHAASGARITRRDLSGGQDRSTIATGATRIDLLACSPDGRRLAAAGDASLRVWTDLADPHVARTPDGERALALGFDATGARIGVAGGPTGFLELFDAATARMITRFPAGELVRHAALDPTLARAAVASLDHVTLYGLGTGAQLASTPAQTIERGALALPGPDGALLWSDPKGDLVRFQPGQGFLQKLEGQIGVITQLACSTDGRVLAALGSDGTLTLWQLR